MPRQMTAMRGRTSHMAKRQDRSRSLLARAER